MIYYQPDKQQPLADFAHASNARWLAANPKAKISELPAIERLKGKPAFLRFAFDNQGKAQQAYEIGAAHNGSGRRPSRAASRPPQGDGSHALA